MKHKTWLTPSFMGEGLCELFFSFPRILLFSLLTLALSLPVVTLGGAHLALFAVLRRTADGEKVPVRDYFAAFRKSILPGFGYGLMLVFILLAASLPAKGALGFCLVTGCFLLYAFLLFYPAVFNAGYRGFDAFLRSASYAMRFAWESLFLVGLAVLFLFAAYYLSEILLFLFFPLTYYISACIVIGNNRDDAGINFQEEKE